LAFSWRFYVLELSARKRHTTLFPNNFPLTKMFLVSYIWQYFCRQKSGQRGVRRKPVSRLNTVDKWHVRGVPGATVPGGDRLSSLSRTSEVFGCDL
jgi:hypothetical protein